MIVKVALDRDGFIQFLRELENFPEGGHDDIVDALSGAFLMLTDATYDLTALTML